VLDQDTAIAEACRRSKSPPPIRPSRAGGTIDPAAHRERRLGQLIDRLPKSWRSTARWLRQPSQRWLRMCVGTLLIIGSLLSVLPLFGLWMLPLGLVLLAEDVPVLRRATDRVLEWIERRRPHWLRRTSSWQPVISTLPEWGNHHLQSPRTGNRWTRPAYGVRLVSISMLACGNTWFGSTITWRPGSASLDWSPLSGTTGFYRQIAATPLIWLVMLAPLGALLFLSFRIRQISADAAQAIFWGYAALTGLSLAGICLIFTGASVARVFFISAASFTATSLYGYATSRDLAQLGSFLFIGLIGIVLASLVDIFIGSSALQFAISVIGVVVFTGLTAFNQHPARWAEPLQEIEHGFVERSADLGQPLDLDCARDRARHR
jgi:FtsH-binding integral membrane protein